MNVEQAFQVVAQAAQSASLPYQAHLQVQEALKVLVDKLNKKDDSNS